MAQLEHPSSLNPFQRYKQACAVLQHTSRARQSAWYLEATELEFQVHIRIDGTSIQTFHYFRSTDTWSQTASISESVLTDPEQATAYGEELIKKAHELNCDAVGVAIHIADEFSTAELKPEFNSPSALPELRETAVTDPIRILDDSSVNVEKTSWRVIPYPATHSETIGTTVSISKRINPFITSLRTLGDAENFPIVLHSLSAPLVALSSLSEVISPESEHPFVAILQYPWFTVLAFFNEHKDLRLLRTLQHRGLTRPSNFRQAIQTTNSALEFLDPDLYVVPLNEHPDVHIVEDLNQRFPGSRVQKVQFPRLGKIPRWMPELPLALAKMPEDQTGLSHTFGVLRGEKWFLQDALPANQEVLELFPTRNEMRLLRLAKLARVAVILIAFLGVAFVAFSAYAITRRPEWKFSEEEANAVKQRLVGLNQTRQKIDHWNNLLEDRSKAWTSMEALAQLFPDKSNILLDNFTHTVRPDNVPGQAKVGFIKEWVITGAARDEALAYLNSLNTREGITAQFARIAELTGDQAYDPEPNTRTIVVNVRTQENSSFRQVPAGEVVDSDKNSYPFTFNLTITQRFESADPLAINASKAP